MTDSPPNVPLVDLKAQYASIAPEVDAAIRGTLERCDFILGRAHQEFESDFAAFCRAKHALGCASGTDALNLACRVAGVGEGDEVILPAFTFVATALGVTLAGGKPVLVDVDPHTGLMDPTLVEAAITGKTKAILPVHLYGQCADMTALRAIADQHGLKLIEDAAQAHGADWQGTRAGGLGDIACFSFYPGKNLGAYGDGGAIATNDDALAEQLILLRNWGSKVKYHHEEMGLNSRLDTVQAAILGVKLARLDGWNQRRREFAQAYDEALAGMPGVELTRTANARSVYHLYVIRVADRDRVLDELHGAGIGAGIHYPFAVHELGAYRWLGYEAGAFPVSEDWARRCLSLPIYAEMPADTPARAAAVLGKAVAQGA